jgi:2-polyprenyl-3-methyl-5-hydroxy-6-metoxy-1,4-benzoquinol methylase
MRQAYDPDVYWDERCKRCGHTGWSNELLYRYDQPLKKKAISRILSMAGVEIEEDTKILDIGCGIGDIVELLADKGACVTGIDISKEAVRKSRERFLENPMVNIVTEKVEDMKFSPNSFDLVTSITVLQHIVEEEKFSAAVQNIVRVTKSGGYILILEATHGKEINVSYIKARDWQRYVRIFEENGCLTVYNTSYPQVGIKFVQMLSKLVGLIFFRGKKEENRNFLRNNKYIFFKKVLKYLYNMTIAFILKISYPLDHWLSLPLPLRISSYRILLFQKE